MYVLILVIFLGLIPDITPSYQKFHYERYSEDATSKMMFDRILNLTRATYYDARMRISSINNIRFLYEKTSLYEQGFIFSEMIERYKKIVDQYKRVTTFGTQITIEALNRMEHSQKLYFEIYHLFMMLHEINRKYRGVPGVGAHLTEEEKEDMLKKREAFKLEEEQRLMAIKMMMLAEKQEQKKKVNGPRLSLEGKKNKEIFQMKPYQRNNTFPKRFPKDYGWEPPSFDGF